MKVGKAQNVPGGWDAAQVKWFCKQFVNRNGSAARFLSDSTIESMLDADVLQIILAQVAIDERVRVVSVERIRSLRVAMRRCLGFEE
jgi:hypothetical protein